MEQVGVTIHIELAWPEPCLWPNRKDHHMAKAPAIAIARQEGKIETLKALDARPFEWLGGEVRLAVTGHKPNDRKRDRPNLQTALKPHIDGIADALGVDDAHFVVTTEWGEMRPPRGGVSVEISQ